MLLFCNINSIQDFQKNAKWHCDAHIIEYISKSAKIACSVFDLKKSVNQTKCPVDLSSTDLNNIKWVSVNENRYKFTIMYGISLCEEYEYRFKKQHSFEKLLRWLINNIPIEIPRKGKIRPFEYSLGIPRYDDIFESYKFYYKYIKTKVIKMKWKNRTAPHWIK